MKSCFENDVWCMEGSERMLKNHEISKSVIVKEDNSSFQSTKFLMEIYKWKLVGKVLLDAEVFGSSCIDIDLVRAKSLSSLQLWCAMNGYDYELSEEAQAEMGKEERESDED